MSEDWDRLVADVCQDPKELRQYVESRVRAARAQAFREFAVFVRYVKAYTGGRDDQRVLYREACAWEQRMIEETERG